jgi:hypothetical protein
MQVMLADPTDPFYIDNIKFVLQRELSTEEIASYQKHLDDVISRLKTLERVTGQQVEIRLFKNQMRAPIIIIDDKVCILTVRLPPFESKQSLRIEFDTAPPGFQHKVHHTLQSALGYFSRILSNLQQTMTSLLKYYIVLTP